MVVNTYNQKGEKIGETKLPSKIFNVKMNSDLVHQVLVSQMARQRQGTAQVKDRAEVRGGGRKPWRQKGTGRARHGSTRSPLWRHGGVTFGPTKEKNFKKIIPKKMRRKALFMVLTEKAKRGLLLILDKLNLEEPKTKLMKEIIENQMKNFKIQQKEIKEEKEKKKKKPESVLIILPQKDENVIRASQNLPKTATIQAKELNVLDILKYKYLIMLQEGLKVIEKTFIL